jgi:hypothetical protein
VEEQNVEVANSPTVPNDDFDEDEPEICDRCGGRFYEYLHDYTCERCGNNFVCRSCEQEMTECGICEDLRFADSQLFYVEVVVPEISNTGVVSAGESKESVDEAFQNVSNTIFMKKEVFTDGEFKGMMESLLVIFENQSATRPATLPGHNIMVNDGYGETTIYTNCPDPWNMDTEQFNDWSYTSSVVFRDYAIAVADGEIDGQEEDEEPEIVVDENDEEPVIVVDENDEDEDSTDDEDEDSTVEGDEEDEEEQFRCLRCGRNWSNRKCIECEVRGLRGVFQRGVFQSRRR